jgi:hypothetical protein
VALEERPAVPRPAKFTVAAAAVCAATEITPAGIMVVTTVGAAYTATITTLLPVAAFVVKYASSPVHVSGPVECARAGQGPPPAVGGAGPPRGAAAAAGVPAAAVPGPRGGRRGVSGGS